MATKQQEVLVDALGATATNDTLTVLTEQVLLADVPDPKLGGKSPHSLHWTEKKTLPG